MRIGKGNISLKKEKEYGEIIVKFSCDGFESTYKFNNILKSFSHHEMGYNYGSDGSLEKYEGIISIIKDTFFAIIGKEKKNRWPNLNFVD